MFNMIEKCKNPENKDCDNEAERTHRLVEKDDNEKDYPMCNECYERLLRSSIRYGCA